MNVIFTCGGTAGHVNPAIALAGLMQRRDPSVKILFVGSKRGMEGRSTISAAPSNLRRSSIICTRRHW